MAHLQFKLRLAISCHPGAALGFDHWLILALTTFCCSSGNCQTASDKGKTLAARVQKPPLPWLSCATNQCGAVGHQEGATDWQGAVGHRAAQYRAVHWLTQAPPARNGVVILHMCVLGQIRSCWSQRGWSSGRDRHPATSPDLNSPHAAGHQVFAQIPPDGDSAFSSLLCSEATAHSHLTERGRKPPQSSRMGPG